MTPGNVVAWCAQVGLLVLVCAGLPRLLRLTAPGVQHAFWRVLLLVCLALPVLQPRRAALVTVVSVAAAVERLPSRLPDIRVRPGIPIDVPRDAVPIVSGVIGAGIALRLAWIAAGMVRLRRLRRRASEPITGFDDLQRAIGAAPPMRWSADVRHPVTFGMWRPVVVLPAVLKNADAGALRAVVAHELHHVKRRDWAWTVAEEVLRSIFWFHPGMWWLISRVQLARETVVDELSILVTNARRTYLDTLLTLAGDTTVVSSPAFSARRQLSHRVMLLSREEGMSSIRVATASALLILALGVGSAGVVSAFPLYRAPQQPTGPAAEMARRYEPLERSMPQLVPMTPEFKALLERLKPITLGRDDAPPRKIKDVKPVFPPEARAAGIQGIVLLEAVIDRDGTVAGARVLRSVPELDEAALDAVQQWLFERTVRNGDPVAVLMIVTITFTIR